MAILANAGAGWQWSAFAWLVCGTLLLTACGAAPANSHSESGLVSITVGPVVPFFTSTPGTVAEEGTTYTYQTFTAPVGDALTLVTAPVGATLNNGTITWTPTAAQSRVTNRFTLAATNAGGTATQSWTITPMGTISGVWIDTYWTPNGPVPVPHDFGVGTGFPRAYVFGADGFNYDVIGSGNPDGTFSIPNVPGGYYWLESGTLSSYWTSSSNIDLSRDITEQAQVNNQISASNTNLVFNVSGLDPVQTGDEVFFLFDMSPPILVPGLYGLTSALAGATTASLNVSLNATFDFSKPNPAFLLEYEPETIATLSATALGPQLSLPDFSLVNGGYNRFNETLVSSPPRSFDLGIQGSAWASLFNNAGPIAPALTGADFQVTTLPFLTAVNTLSTSGFGVPLLADLPPPANPLYVEFPSLSPVCPGSTAVAAGTSVTLPGEPPITTNQDFGPVHYEDGFSSAWPRVFTFCETASVPLAIPGSSAPVSFQLEDVQSTALPTGPISPFSGQVRNPTINGSSFFSANTVVATRLTLNWTAPSGAAPTGYAIATYFAVSAGSYANYVENGIFYTTQTTASLPPLTTGSTYVFVISSIVDGAANFENSPNRSALPTASFSIVSAPITVSGQ